LAWRRSRRAIEDTKLVDMTADHQRHQGAVEEALESLAFRPAQLPMQFQATLDASTRTPGILRLDVDGLTEPEAAQLLGPHVGGAWRATCTCSGGNPFYLEQLARSGNRIRLGRRSRGHP
jgi:hypothetical protein